VSGSILGGVLYFISIVVYCFSDPFSGVHDGPWSTEPRNEHQYMKQRARDEQVNKNITTL
jgi:hypothetical protein